MKNGGWTQEQGAAASLYLLRTYNNYSWIQET